MGAKELQALPEVAGIGLHRLRRQPPLAAQMRQPLHHGLDDAFVGTEEGGDLRFFVCVRVSRLCLL
ncbi:hypothetical protein SSBR45G_17530 [Bradyrhizobium sp. SSBR45G]|nr:hypothetical protein SSBR45G_17530 [Bradyrhizobium sp. SSBR45G]GLH83603.1 hypothetical protein SSBR45R_10630 [Bradyrhizobium sp. SSBR45R]